MKKEGGQNAFAFCHTLLEVAKLLERLFHLTDFPSYSTYVTRYLNIVYTHYNIIRT